MSGELGVLYTSTNYTTNVNMGLVAVSLTEVHHDSNQVSGKKKKKAFHFLWVAMYPENILLCCNHSCVFRNAGAHSLSLKIAWGRGKGRAGSGVSAEIVSTPTSAQ